MLKSINLPSSNKLAVIEYKNKVILSRKKKMSTETLLLAVFMALSTNPLLQTITGLILMSQLAGKTGTAEQQSIEPLVGCCAPGKLQYVDAAQI